MRHSSGALCAFAAAILILGGTFTASAWRTVDAINAFNDYNSAMYFVLSGNQGYYRVAQGSGSVDSFWHFAEEIEMVRDATLLTNSHNVQKHDHPVVYRLHHP